VKNTNDIYIHHEDPGHGWLEVSCAEIKALGIADKISSYSYLRGGKMYLEEDCDMAVFLAAKRAKGESVEIKEVYQKRTPIRGYQRFFRNSGGPTL